MEYLLIYLSVVNLLAVIVCTYDKIAAKHGMKRIRESTLLWISVFGGAAAMYMTMRIIRHKTKHNKFMVTLPLVILLQTAIILLFFKRFS